MTTPAHAADGPALPGHHQPCWDRPGQVRHYPPLFQDQEADVAIVGAGITGLTAALRLQEEGRRVIVLELGRVGGGTTGHSTGHLDNSLDYSLDRLLSDVGEEAAQLIVSAKRAAMNHIEQQVRGLALDCDFTRVPGYLYAARPEDGDHVRNEWRAAERLRLPVRLDSAAPLPFRTGPAVCFLDQARIDPLAYVRGLAAAFVDRGGQVCEDTRVEDFEERNGRVEVTTNRAQVRAEMLILAGHAPLVGKYSLQSRAQPQQSYVLAVRVAEAVPDALFWDTADPYHYIRRMHSDDPQVLLVGGADHHTGTTQDTQACYDSLTRYAREHFPGAAVTCRWSSELFDPVDGVPYVGRAPRHDRVFVAAAYSGDGLTFGTVGGLLTSHLVLGRENAWSVVFDPARIKPLKSAGQFGSIGLKVAKHFVGDRLRGGEVSDVSEIPAGAGRLVVTGGQRLAVYRDEQNQLHALSPACTHMGCIVHWNAAERTWDCPCHGGRYDAYGKVIMGPPGMSLARQPLPHAAPPGGASL